MDLRCAYAPCSKVIVPKSKHRRKFCKRGCSLKYGVQKWRLLLKQKALAYKGGACERCGYDRCQRALEFHHRDPSIKSFGLAQGGKTRSWAKVKAEIEKCDLLCANCHREVEDLKLGRG